MVNAIDLLLNSQSTSLRIQNCVSRWNAKKVWCFLSHKKPRTLQGKQRTFPDKSFSIFKSIWWIVHVLCCIFKCSKFYSSLFEEVIFFPTFVLSFLSFSQLSGVCCFIRLSAARQTPLSMGFSRQEYCSGLPSPSPGDLLSPGIEPTSLALVGGFYTTVPTGKPNFMLI